MIDMIELYTFSSIAATFRLTPHEFDVDLGGSLYESLQLERNSLAIGAEASKMALELKVPAQCGLARHLLDASLTGQPTSVTLQSADYDEMGGAWTISRTLWMGRVLGVEFGRDAARIRCESAHVSLKRIGLRRLYSRACSHVLYSTECGATPITHTAQVDSVSGVIVNLVNVPASVTDVLAGGWLQTSSGQRHMIAGTGSSSVSLLYPADIAAGDTVTLTAGCDHSMATCQARFNNLDNFGGFPFIPSKNPFTTGVF